MGRARSSSLKSAHCPVKSVTGLPMMHLHAHWLAPVPGSALIQAKRMLFIIFVHFCSLLALSTTAVMNAIPRAPS